MDDDQARTQAEERLEPGSVGRLRLFGIPIRFHFTFIILLIWLLVLAFGKAQSGAATSIYILGLFGSVLIHEVSHALVARRYGIRTLEIVMLPIGGVAKLERQPERMAEFWIAIAGPASNFVIAALLFGGLALTHRLVGINELAEPTDAHMLERIAAGNLLLAVFNLLPAFPMDGGRILRSLLARSRPEHEATRIAARIGMFMAALMGLYGLLNSNFLLIFVALFVYVGAMQESMVSAGRSLMRGEPVRAAMETEFRTLTHGQTIHDAAQLLLATSQQDFPVKAGDSVVGLLSRTALLRAMAREGPQAYVAGTMDRNFARVTPDMDLADAVPVLAKSGNCALVFENDLLTGMLTTENVSEFLVLRRISRGIHVSPDVENHVI